jgi:hypothetical protein
MSETSFYQYAVMSRHGPEGSGGFPGCSWPNEGSHVAIYESTDGRLVVVIERAGEESERYIFQRVWFVGRGMFLFEVGWSLEQGAFIRINGAELLADPESVVLRHVVDLGDGGPSVPDTLLYPDLRAQDTSDRSGVFFLETIRDIDSKVLQGSKYALIKATGMLRLLLLDSPTLIDRVNKEHKRRILYETIDSSESPPLPSMTQQYQWRNPDPVPFPGARSSSLSRTRFLAMHIASRGSTRTTVRDLIRACANAAGGVHYGVAGGAAEQAALELDQEVQLSGPEERSRCRRSIRRGIWKV